MNHKTPKKFPTLEALNRPATESDASADPAQHCAQTAKHSAAPKEAFTPPYPPLAEVSKPNLTTAELAYYLDRRPNTLRAWACREDGPIRPIRSHGRLAWPTDQAKVVAGLSA